MKLRLIALALIGVFNAFAGTSVKISKLEAKQRYPWNGKVDIVVTLNCTTNDLPHVAYRIVATNCVSGSEIPITNIEDRGYEVVSGTTCRKKFLWDSLVDVGTVRIDDVSLTLEAVYEPQGVQLWLNGPIWAECNVGASSPKDYGYYFWWGDTVGYKLNASYPGFVSVKDGSSYSFSSCATYGKSNSSLRSAGYIDSTGNLTAEHDAATAHLGAPWRMPTDEEFSALISNCNTTWTRRSSAYGRLVTGKGDYADKSIFLPAPGYVEGSSCSCNEGSDGYYWSSTPYSGNSDCAWYLSFSSSYFSRGYGGYDRYRGKSVRALRGFAE